MLDILTMEALHIHYAFLVVEKREYPHIKITSMLLHKGLVIFKHLQL
jgi:hypothetical protein